MSQQKPPLYNKIYNSSSLLRNNPISAFNPILQEFKDYTGYQYSSATKEHRNLSMQDNYRHGNKKILDLKKQFQQSLNKSTQFQPQQVRKSKGTLAGYNILNGTPIPMSHNSIKLLSRRSKKLLPLVIDQTKPYSFTQNNSSPIPLNAQSAENPNLFIRNNPEGSKPSKKKTYTEEFLRQKRKNEDNFNESPVKDKYEKMYDQQMYMSKGKKLAKYEIEIKIHEDEIQNQDKRREARIRKMKITKQMNSAVNEANILNWSMKRADSSQKKSLWDNIQTNNNNNNNRSASLQKGQLQNFSYNDLPINTYNDGQDLQRISASRRARPETQSRSQQKMRYEPSINENQPVINTRNNDSGGSQSTFFYQRNRNVLEW